MIKIENLVHKYTIWKDENIKSEKTVLDGISLDIPSGQFVAILGPNGSGKSTLAKHLNVLLLPNEGTVWIDGKDTRAKERLWEIRSQVGMVFQNPDNQIIGTSVEEDVAFGPENKNIEPEKIRKIVETVLRKVKLWDRRKASPSILSGGQKQRLATADALAGLPACLVLDEPTAMLDPDSRKEVINIVKELNRKEGMTIILITHHTDEVVDADRIVLMKDGKIIGDDIPKKIFADYELLKKAKMDIDFDENNNRAVYIEIKGMDYERAAKKICCELYDAGVLKEEIDTTDWDVLARAIKKRLLDDKEERIPYLLLLLDEADTFIESCTEVNFKPFDALKEIQNIGMDRFKFVIAGLHNIVRFKRDAALSNNSVITHLSSITIRPFHTKDARQLLEEPLYCLGFRFPKERQALISLILASTNYFPGLIQLYCANLIEAMKKDDYAGYDEGNTPAYEVTQKHIKKVLSDPSFMNQIREKFEITLKLDEDNMYYIIALLMAYLYHQNANSAADSEGFSAEDIKEAAIGVGINQVAVQKTQVINGLMQELLELNILRHTVNEKYLFSRYSFFQMMGTSDEIDSRLLEYMENQ